MKQIYSIFISAALLLNVGDETKVGEICALNGLDDGDHIYAGQILLLP